ncbi:hypothetical protein [Brevundimonas aurantiaca]|nr:hypothetical protein [Brevundimonas aurantiaca]
MGFRAALLAFTLLAGPTAACAQQSRPSPSRPPRRSTDTPWSRAIM